MSLEVLKRTMLANHYSNTTLRGIIDRAQTRVQSLRASGFNNSPTEQVSINRIQAATDILDKRGAFKVGGSTVSTSVTAVKSLATGGSMTTVALVAGGLFLAKKLL